ncbi:MAG: LacI family transcriptional regulator, partial [Spirochaetaceae bacterium]
MPEKKKRITIAFFSNPIRPFYGNINFSDVVFDEARANNASVLWYRGGEQFSILEGDSGGNRIYRLLDRDMIDGVIVSSVGFKSSFRTEEEFMNVMNSVKILPVVSVGLNFPGIPSVVSDSYTDFLMIMEHLITVHGYRRIAMISGPAGNMAMENRMKAYCDALAAHNIQFDPKLVSPPLPWDIYYGKGTGKEAVRILLDERKADFEAMVAANDRLAIGAHEELERRGIRIPEDVALTGYDNYPKTKVMRSPVTTVPHPQPLMLHRGMSVLMDLIQGKEVPELSTICSRLVIRRSCGCVPRPVADLIQSMPELKPSGVSGGSDRKSALRALAADPEKLCTVPGLAGQVLENFLKKILDVCFDGYDKTLLRDFASLLEEYAKEDDFSEWELFLVRIRQRLGGMLPELIYRIDNIILVLQSQFAEHSIRIQYARLLAFDDVSREVHNFNKLIGTATDLPGLFDMVFRELVLTGMKECFISLFTRPDMTGADVRLVFGFSNGVRIQCDPNDPEMVYPASKILPERIIRAIRVLNISWRPFFTTRG